MDHDAAAQKAYPPWASPSGAGCDGSCENGWAEEARPPSYVWHEAMKDAVPAARSGVRMLSSVATVRAQ